MMKYFIFLSFLFISFTSFSQNRKIEKQKSETIEIAYELYRSELASWTSTDILQGSYKETLNKVGGYLSYTKKDETIAIYYDQTEERNVIFSMTFKDILNFKNLFTVDTILRKPNFLENRLIKARSIAKEQVINDKKEFFKYYKNSNYNYVPLIHNDKLLVYILTGPTVGNVVLFGNDYKFEFDKKDRFKEVIKIHNSLLNYPYKAKEGESSILSITHTHILKDYPIISETDLCTLLLYEPYVEWKECIIVNEKYVSFWKLNQRELLVFTTKAWERIQKLQKSNN